MPATWVIPVLGGLAGWFGISLGILTLGDVEPQARELAETTGQGVAALLVGWLLARHLDEDARSGFAVAAEQTGPGLEGLLLGRWAGSILTAFPLAALAGLALGPTGGEDGPWALHLVIATMSVALLAGAWGLLLGAWGGGLLVVLGGMGLWLLGHLPWGSPSWLPGPAGDLLRAWLPGPRPLAEGLRMAGYTSAATLGTLLLTLASTHRRVARG
jgi:hypothetical protein